MNFPKKSAILFTTGFLLFANLSFSADIPKNLRDALDAKTKSLQEITNQIVETQKQLDTTQGEKQSLQKEIQTADYQIKQLNLSIRSSELSIDKLNLEIESLKYDINNTHDKISLKKSAIADLLREVQRKDKENVLVVLLKNKSLAESFQEWQNLESFNTFLSKEIGDLENLDQNLNNKLGLSSNKKQQVQVEGKNLKNKKSIVGGQQEEKKKILIETKNQESIYQKQLVNLEKMQLDISKEIEDIEAELRKNIDPNLLPSSRPGVLAYPVENPKITQGYGVTEFTLQYYTNKSGYHNGLDFGAPIGTPIFAAEKGTVINVGNQDSYCPRGAYGKFIVIKHDNGLTTLYGHLSKYIVSVGQEVERGEVIGYVGKTGWATGPHLHFTVFATNTLSPKKPGFPEGTRASRTCGPMPVGGDIDPRKYL